MKDRYLFRGKRISESAANGEWVIGYYTGEDNKNHYIKDLCGAYYTVIPKTVGQFTGLLDKNGVRIFEGDVVMDTEWKDSPYFPVVWDWNLARFAMDITNKPNLKPVYIEGNHYWGLDRVINDSMIVIGNVHDHPELLKETAQ